MELYNAQAKPKRMLAYLQSFQHMSFCNNAKVPTKYWRRRTMAPIMYMMDISLPIGVHHVYGEVDWESTRSGVLTRSLFNRPLWMYWVSCQGLLLSQMGEHAIYCKEKPLHMECRDPWRSSMYELPLCRNPWTLFSPCIMTPQTLVDINCHFHYLLSVQMRPVSTKARR